MTAHEIRDVVIAAALATLQQSRAMLSVTTDESEQIARAIGCNAAQVIAERLDSGAA